MSRLEQSNSPPKAIILVSGGLDSATVLAIAKSQGYQCYALSLDYGQRHRVELQRAQIVAKSNGAKEHRIVKIDIGSFGGSALTDQTIEVPNMATPDNFLSAVEQEIPITYVPARNTVFLSVALGWAEVVDASVIFIGANAVDYSGYPDCRPEFIAAFQNMANLATKIGVEGGAADAIKIEAPIINLSKAEIIKTGLSLNVDYSETISCYDPDPSGNACSVCESCQIRQAGFVAAGIVDPAA